MCAQCWQNYVDYHKCINVKGEEFSPCKQFYFAYRSLCPNSWLERWDTQRGTSVPRPCVCEAVGNCGTWRLTSAIQRTETSLPG